MFILTGLLFFFISNISCKLMSRYKYLIVSFSLSKRVILCSVGKVDGIQVNIIRVLNIYRCVVCSSLIKIT